MTFNKKSFIDAPIRILETDGNIRSYGKISKRRTKYLDMDAFQ